MVAADMTSLKVLITSIVLWRHNMVASRHFLGVTLPNPGRWIWTGKTVSDLVTVRNEVAKVMFLHLSVCPQGVCLSACWDTTPPGAGTPPPEQAPKGAGTPTRAGPTPQEQPPREQAPPPADGYCCGRYASYWNAFLSSKENAKRITRSKVKQIHISKENI